MAKTVEDKNLLPGQQEAVKRIRKFLKSDSQFFLLEGLAGTGKSFTISEALKKKNKKGEWYIPSYVMGFTVSHIAKLVLMNSIPQSTSFASLMNQKMVMKEDKYDPLGVTFGGSPDPEKLKNIRIFVGDESGLYNDDQLKMLIKAAPPCSKFILMGDKTQLPPIGVDGDEDSSVFRIKDRYKLTTPVRQAEEDEIYQLSLRFADMINGNIAPDFNSIPLKKIQDNGKGYEFISENQAIDSLVQRIRNGEDAIMCSFTNQKRKVLIEEIRLRLWGEDAIDIQEGDILIGKNQYGMKGSWRNGKYISYGEPKFYNGQRFRVNKVRTKHLKAINKKPIIDLANSLGYDDKNYIFSILKQIEKLIGAGLKVYSVRSDDVNGVFNIIHEEHSSKYWAVVRLLREIAAMPSVRYYGYVQEFQSKFASVDYGYCVTLYKVQGSTHDYAYVDYNDIMSCDALSIKRRLQSLYVAATRPKKNLYLF